VILSVKRVLFYRIKRAKAMKRLEKQVTKMEKDDGYYLRCPVCGDRVLYVRRSGHKCFKFHLMDIDMIIKNMGEKL
jgi:DNA-directed RNA polymerase subunit RPC12/RpoP